MYFWNHHSFTPDASSLDTEAVVKCGAQVVGPSYFKQALAVFLIHQNVTTGKINCTSEGMIADMNNVHTTFKRIAFCLPDAICEADKYLHTNGTVVGREFDAEGFNKGFDLCGYVDFVVNHARIYRNLDISHHDILGLATSIQASKGIIFPALAPAT